MRQAGCSLGMARRWLTVFAVALLAPVRGGAEDEGSSAPLPDKQPGEALGCQSCDRKPALGGRALAERCVQFIHGGDARDSRIIARL